MKELIFQAIWEIEQWRKDSRHEPDTVLKKDLLQKIHIQIDRALEELEQEKRITKGPALSDDYYKTTIS